MKTKLLLFFSFLIATMYSVKAQEDPVFRLTYGYGDCRNGVGSNTKTNMAAAIQFTKESIRPYAGNKITKIRFYILCGIIDDLKIFVTNQLTGSYTYEQKVDKVNDWGWNEIVLDTPFEIEEKEIFIGYELNGKGTTTLGILGSNITNTLGDWYRVGDEWKHISEYPGWSSVMAIEALIQGDNLPKTDAKLENVILTKHPILNKPTSLSGTIFNNGVDTIENINITYEINNKKQTNKITGLSIPYESTGNFVDPNFLVTEEGEFDVKITISNINGKEDLTPENNTVEKHIFCKEHFEQRNVLVEMFTTESCPNCVDGHHTLDAILKDHDRIVRVEHHAGYGIDKYTVPASKEYLYFYGVGYGTYAPALMLDRCNMAEFGALDRYDKPSPIPVFAISNSIKGILEESLNTPAYASIELEVDTTELPKLKIKVSGKAILPITGDSSRLNIYITEDNIFTSTQSNSVGKWYHQHTLRENLTHFHGDSIDLEKGFESEYTTEIPDKWNKNQLNVVAFVSNYDSNDVNNCVVYNAAEFSLYDKANSIEEIQETIFPKVYVSGDKLYIDGDYVQADLFNCKGENRATFEGRNNIDISNLEKGLYIVRVLTKEKVKSFKVVISY